MPDEQFQAGLEAALEEAEKGYAEEHDRPLETFVKGAATTVAPIESLLPEAQKKRLGRLQSENPIADIAGTLTGYAGGAIAGAGVPGLVTGAGRAVAKAVTPQVGKVVGKKVGDLTGRLAAGVVEGAGISLSEATNKSAIDLITGVPGAAAQFAEAAGEGAVWGGALGGGAHILGGIGNKLFQKTFSKQIKAVAKAKQARLKANTQYELATNYLKQHADATVPPRLRGTADAQPWIERHVKDVLGPVQKRMKAADQQVRTSLTQALKMSAKKAENATDQAVQSGLAYAVGGLPAVILRNTLIPAFRLLQWSVFKGIEKTPIARAMLSNSLMKGRLSGTKMMATSGQFTHMPTRYDKYVEMATGVAPAAKVPPIQHWTTQDFHEAADEIEATDLAEYENEMRMGMASQGVPQEFVNPQVAQQQRLLDHLKQHMPPRHPPMWVGDTDKKPVPQSQIDKFSRRVRAGMVPVSVIDDFFKNSLTREAADTWWQVHPLAASEFADELQRLVAIATEAGKKFTAKEQRMIGLMTDPSGQMLGRTGNVSLVQTLQMNYANDDATSPPPQVGGPQPKQPNLGGISQNTMDNVQQLTNRAMKRA